MRARHVHLKEYVFVGESMVRWRASGHEEGEHGKTEHVALGSVHHDPRGLNKNMPTHTYVCPQQCVLAPWNDEVGRGGVTCTYIFNPGEGGHQLGRHVGHRTNTRRHVPLRALAATEVAHLGVALPREGGGYGHCEGTEYVCTLYVHAEL